jgi:signal transduction histidine kinase
MRLDTLLRNTEKGGNAFGLKQRDALSSTILDELEIILDIVKAINSSLVLNDVLTLVVDNGIKVARADRGFLMLKNDGGELEFVLARNRSKETIDGKDFEISHSVVRDVYETGVAICLEDAMSKEGYVSRASISNLDLHTIICFPLLVDNDKIGVIYVDSKKINDWNKEEVIHLFEIMIGQAAIAIRNAQLFEKLRKAYDDLRIAREQIMDSEKMAAQGKIAAEIGHEFNNYLTVLMGYTRMLFRELADTKLDEIKARIGESLETMKRFSRGLLDFATLETKKRPNDLNQIITELMKYIQPLSKFQRVKFVTNLGQLPIAQVDEGQFQQLLLNLYGNAADVASSVTITTATHYIPEENKIITTVRDDGPGMPDDVKEKIFKMKITTKERGHGYGLSICKKIVENHQGTIEIETPPDGGTRFVIAMPLT